MLRWRSPLRRRTALTAAINLSDLITEMRAMINFYSNYETSNQIISSYSLIDSAELKVALVPRQSADKQ